MPSPNTITFQRPALRKVKPAPQRLEPPPGFYCPAKLLATDPTAPRRTYCGPWALLALTGRGYGEIRSTINVVRRKRPNAPVAGLSVREMMGTLDRFGFRYKVTAHGFGEKLTLAALLRNRTPEEMEETWLIVASNHYILVRGRKVTCAMLRQWTWTKDAKKRRGEVRYVLRVS